MKAFTFVAMLRQEPSTHQGDEKRGEQDQRQANTVYTHRVLGANGRYPLHAVHELRPAGHVVKAHPQPHREPQREQGDAEGHPANGLDMAPACTDREESNDHQPDERGQHNPTDQMGDPNKLAGFSMLTLRNNARSARPKPAGE